MDDLLQIAGELYGVPASEFTAQRDQRARGLTTDPQLARRVKALRKPSVAAWATNLLVRRDADAADQVLQVGAAMRAALEAADGVVMRRLSSQRREVTSALTKLAGELLAETGVRMSASVASQVDATLTAAIVDEQAGRAFRSGLLVSHLVASGLEPADVSRAVAVPEEFGYAPAPLAPPKRRGLHLVVDPDAELKEQQAARDAAQREVDEAATRYEEAATEHAMADAEVERLQAAGLQLQAEVDELRRRLAELEARQESVDGEVDAAIESRDQATAELKAAESARRRAEATLKRLD